MPLLRGHALRGRVFEHSTGAGIPDAWIGFRPAAAPRTTVAADRQHPTSRRRRLLHARRRSRRRHRAHPSARRSYAYRELELAVDEETAAAGDRAFDGRHDRGDREDGSGCARRRDVCGSNGPTQLHRRTETKPAEFSYEHMRPGRYSVSADTEPGARQLEFVLRPGRDARRTSCSSLAPDAAFAASSGVCDPSNCRQAQLMLRPEAAPAILQCAPRRSRAYAFNGVPPGRAVISVFGGGRQFDEASRRARPTRTSTLDIVFPAGARLSGRVTRRRQACCRQESSGCNWLRTSPASLYRAVASADGQYEIEGLPPGEYRLRADEDISRAHQLLRATRC